MRLIRFGEKGNEKPGLLQGERIIDLRGIFPAIPDIDAGFFEAGWLEKVSVVEEKGEKMDVRIGSPVKRPSKIICLGKNYTEHVKEGGFDKPELPITFAKAPSALNGPFDPIILPQSSLQVDWEVELAVIMGREGKRIPAERAFDYIAGFTIMNDVSGRDVQFGDGQWFRGKSFDSFAPMGPALVTMDEIEDIAALNLTSLVDGEVMQEGNTAEMIFPVPYIVEFLSRDITLNPGDIISTGTPSGVGIFRDPPIVLEPGNVVECRIDKLGALINGVVAEK
jgi:2-keto-4-pentenoate hydratase/2-oxohepta-3-ene-1,7-dioic acid hydratase in catechol pathway